jgi:gamma-glutamylcyclotransferase
LPLLTRESIAIEAWVYVAASRSDDRELRPYGWYKRFITEGALEHHLPDRYIAELDAIEAVIDSDSERDRKKSALMYR